MRQLALARGARTLVETCRYDVECGVGRYCSGNIDPRTCEDDNRG